MRIFHHQLDEPLGSAIKSFVPCVIMSTTACLFLTIIKVPRLSESPPIFFPLNDFSISLHERHFFLLNMCSDTYTRTRGTLMKRHVGLVMGIYSLCVCVFVRATQHHHHHLLKWPSSSWMCGQSVEHLYPSSSDRSAIKITISTRNKWWYYCMCTIMAQVMLNLRLGWRFGGGIWVEKAVAIWFY